MAVISTLKKKSLVLRFDGGIVDGKQTFKTKTFSQINKAADDEAIWATANALEGLQERDLLTVNKVATDSLSQ